MLRAVRETRRPTALATTTDQVRYGGGVRLVAGVGQPIGLEEERKHGISGRLGEGRGEDLLQPEAGCHQVVLGREVVHDRAVSDSQLLGDAAVTHPAEALREGHCGGEDRVSTLAAADARYLNRA